MDWTTLWASLSGSEDEDGRRAQQPAPHGQGRGCRVSDRRGMDAAGFRHKQRVAPVLLIILPALKDDEKTHRYVTRTPLGHTSTTGRDQAQASYAWRQRATHCSNGTSSSTVLDLHSGKGVQCFHARKRAPSAC